MTKNLLIGAGRPGAATTARARPNLGKEGSGVNNLAHDHSWQDRDLTPAQRATRRVHHLCADHHVDRWSDMPASEDSQARLHHDLHQDTPTPRVPSGVTRAVEHAEAALAGYDQLTSGTRRAGEFDWARTAGSLAGELRSLIVHVRHQLTEAV